ncbi:MAG TPA: DUF819 family protein [Clostridia bacterium]|nr:DUF819 family protein [Clostridia bacterium]
MLTDIIIVLLVLLIPRVTVLLNDRFKFFNMLGPVFLCYITGFAASFLLKDTSMASTLAEVCVPVAIPLILFSADLSSLKKLARPAITSFMVLIVAVGLVCAAAQIIFKNSVADVSDINGMLMGVYVGGTPNLIAVGMALGVSEDTIVLVNTCDMIVGGVYFLLILSVMPRLFRSFLPKFDLGGSKGSDERLEGVLGEKFIAKKVPFSFKMLLERLPIFLLAVASVGVSLGASWLITGSFTNMMVVMLGVTTCGVALSFVKKVRAIPGSYTAGQYFIYMFSVAIGLTFDLSMITLSSLMMLLMLAFVQFGSVFLHMILVKPFKIDADTALITSTAGIYGPAFIPPVANAMRNKEVILTGLVCGILGIALGNYLGIGIATLFRLIG